MSDLELVELALRRIVMREHESINTKGSSNIYKIEFFTELADEIATIRASRQNTAEPHNE